MLIASCHCGGISLEIARRPRSLTDCNCSICRRYGALWAYYTRRSVHLSAASEKTGIYQRRVHGLEFHFCSKCACVMFHERARKEGAATRIGVNTRMMNPDDLRGLTVQLLDGAKTWKVLSKRRLPA